MSWKQKALPWVELKEGDDVVDGASYGVP